MSLIRRILGINNRWKGIKPDEVHGWLKRELRRKMKYYNGKPQGYGMFYFRGSYYAYKVKMVDYQETYYRKRRVD